MLFPLTCAQGSSRLPEGNSMRLHFEKCVLDTDRRELWRGESPVPVQPQVFDLLAYLIENRDRVVTKDDLLAAVWGVSPQNIETRAVDMHIARLRAKLRAPSGADTPEAILTVRGRGYTASPDLMPMEARK